MTEQHDNPAAGDRNEQVASGDAPAQGPTLAGPISAGRDVNIATHQTIIYSAEEHRRRLDDYLALLRKLAKGERGKALLAPEPPLTDGLPLDKLRLAMARAAIAWQPPLPAPHEPLDELTRRSLVAGLLLPLMTTPLLILTTRGKWALEQLSSNKVAVLVQREGLAYIGRKVALDRDALTQAQLALTKALADPKYAPGCARLLADLAEGEAGQTALAVALSEHQRASAGHSSAPPPVVQLLATGALGGAAGAGLLMAALNQLISAAVEGERVAPTEIAPPPGARPTPAPGGTWSIPVTLAEWRAELERRNERFGAPAGYWCYVRPGTYRIGGWERNQPHADLKLQGFWVARVPVTVAQYAAFIEAGGYGEARWWTPQGLKWLRERKRQEPYRWREKPFNSRERQAVGGIRWYEAAAFCAWWNVQLPRAIPAGYTLRLPSEAEWEAAAAFDAAFRRQTYPWGEQALTVQRAVFGRNYEEGPPDVATCPDGAAACGALDMVGTVWEWTASSYEAYPDRASWLKEDFTLNKTDASVRGGSYYSSETNVRCGARGRNLLGSDVSSGFRVVLAPQLAHLS